MLLGKAINSDIASLVDLRISYLREDLGEINTHDLSVIELKSTDDGYALYKSVGFEDALAEYHNMKVKLN